VTDSTSDLRPEVLKQYGVHMVPLSIQIGDKTYLDRVDLEPETPVSYRINTPIPNVAIAAQAETNDTHYQYGYLYSTQ
jgi:fatty acid-binding protein DegV